MPTVCRARPRGPAIDRGNDRLPHPWVMVAHAAVDPGLLPVDGAASGQKMRFVRRYSRSSSVTFSRGASCGRRRNAAHRRRSIWRRRIARSSQRSIQASEIASEVGLSRMFAFSGLFRVM